MTRRAWWLTGLAALVVVPAASLAVAVARLDPNDLKPSLIAAVQDATGRTFRMNGDMRISRSLWPTVEVEDVTLANLPGGSRPDMARAERITVELSIPALLSRRIEVTRLTLIGPNILFEQVDGKPNWRFDLPTQAEPDPAPTPDASAPYKLRIRNAQIVNGMVTWRLPARTKVVGIRALDVKHPVDHGPVTFAGTFVYADNEPFAFSGSALPTDGLSGPWQTRLDFAAFDTVASAEGSIDTAGTYDLQIEARAGAVEQLNALLPEMGLPAVHHATLSTRLTNGKQPGDLPVIGATRLRFAEADLGSFARGLALGAFDIGIDKPDGTATLAGTGRYAGLAFTVDGNTGVPVHPDERIDLPIDLTVKGAPGTLGLKGKLALQTLAFQGLDATVALAAPALASLRPMVPALPALTKVRFDGHLTIPAAAASVVFKQARLASTQGDLAGDGTLGPGSALSARLQSGTLDLDAMLGAFGIDPAPPTLRQGAGGGANGPLIPDEPLAWGVLRGPTLDVTADFASLGFMDQTWKGIHAAVQVKAGRMTRGTLALASAGGPIALSMTADATLPAVPVSLSIDAPALPLALVARYAGLPGRVSGTARVQARLKAVGPSLHDLAASLDGTVSLAAIGGQLSNVAFIELTSASLAALGITVPAQGETALRCLGIGAAFQQGVGRLAPIALETTYLALDGVGQIDLGRETVALHLKPLATVSGSKVTVPVIVEGPFRGISGRLDANAFDKIGLLIDSWFGDDRPTACADNGLLPQPAR